MRSLLVLSILVATACAPEPEPLTPEGVAQVWTGSFQSDDGCYDSELRFELVHGGDGWLTGFMTERVPADNVRRSWGLQADTAVSDLDAVYRVDASLDEGRLTLDLVDLLAGDESFCLSSAELWSDGDSGALTGAWDAPDCGCTGSSELLSEG